MALDRRLASTVLWANINSSLALPDVWTALRGDTQTVKPGVWTVFCAPLAKFNFLPVVAFAKTARQADQSVTWALFSVPLAPLVSFLCKALLLA